MLGRLVDQGNTVLVIEHNLDVIKTADWLVDMGPEGGSRGGTVVAEGTPEEVAADPDSYTGQFLAPLLEGRPQPPPAACRDEEGRRREGPAKKAAAKKAAAKKAPPRRPPPRRPAKQARGELTSQPTLIRRSEPRRRPRRVCRVNVQRPPAERRRP